MHIHTQTHTHTEIPLSVTNHAEGPVGKTQPLIFDRCNTAIIPPVHRVRQLSSAPFRLGGYCASVGHGFGLIGGDHASSSEDSLTEFLTVL